MDARILFGGVMNHFLVDLLFCSAFLTWLLQPSALKPIYNWSVRLRRRCWGRKYRVRRSRRYNAARLRVG